MRRLLFVVLVGVLLNTGASFAQEKDAPQMPEKVREVLEWRIGTWNYVIVGKDVKATLVYRWAPGNTCIIGDIHAMVEGKPFFSSHIIGWDGASENGTRMNMVSKIENWSDQSKIVSNTTEEGAFSGFMSGKVYSGRNRLVKQDEDHMTAHITGRRLGNESISDMNILFTRVRPSTRKDFEELCQMAQGAWVGKIPLRQDVPGLGKKGEIATAHYDYTIVEDGNALVGKFYWPGGTQTDFIVYDEANQQIKNVGISPGFGMHNPTFHYSDRKWTIASSRTTVDGATINLSATAIFSTDGKIFTVTGSRTTGGERAEFVDVWHRMNE